LINNHKQCQRLCRGFSARRFTKRLRIETRKRRVKQAKSWRQVAEDPANPGIPIDPDTTLLTQDQQRIVWTSLETGETVDEEPVDGYTDVKRCLHLEKVYGISEFIMNPLLTMDAVDMVAFQEAKRHDRGVPSCRGAFTSLDGLVSISRCRGWFLCRI